MKKVIAIAIILIGAYIFVGNSIVQAGKSLSASHQAKIANATK